MNFPVSLFQGIWIFSDYLLELAKKIKDASFRSALSTSTLIEKLLII